MPTLDEAIANLRAALARVHQLTGARDVAAKRRTVVLSDIDELNTQIAAARVELTEARAAAAAALNAPAPAPEPSPGG